MEKKQNKKWYEILLTLSERKLGIESEKIVEAINLRDTKELQKERLEKDGIEVINGKVDLSLYQWEESKK